MELMELAKDMELQGKAYYLKLANETPIKELSGIFNFLAEEEQRHYELFDFVGKHGKVPEISETSVNTKVKEVFAGMTKSFSIPETIYDYAAAYRKAYTMETESVKYYSELKEKANTELHSFIDFIIKQEKGHASLMESLIDFVGTPKQWIENAEWNHLDLY